MPWVFPVQLLAVLSLLCASFAEGAESQQGQPQRLEFTRLVAHWAEYGDPGYLPFIEEAQPEIVQVGFYGGHFWSLAHTDHGAGYPAHFPVKGLRECGQWFENLNGELHQRNAKVVGHINVKFLVGDPDGPEGPRGFFKFYRDLWDEQELGPKPVENPLDLLEKDAAGVPTAVHNYSIGGMAEYWGCLNNPHWRSVLKAWTKSGIERGLDGYVINYFYRHNCLCSHCQQGFKDFLRDRHSAEQLQARFGIADLSGHQFDEIVSWHDPKESTPLRREMLTFSQVANKRAFDEVFVEYGRSLKNDLILAQWNHLGDFNQINGDERSLLPSELWGRDEDYLWYSSGGAANFTDIAAGQLGETTLQARYIRGAFDDKPFTIGKYESTRIRAAIAELAANGGAPMGFYTRFSDPAAKQEIVRYYQFLKRYDSLFRGNRPHGEAVLLFPRGQIHQGNLEPLAKFKQLGERLLNEHVLFDILPDDIASEERKSAYQQVYAADTTVSADARDGALFSRFAAPTTVRISASRPAGLDCLTLHCVNYNRQEPAEKQSPGSGIVDERPLAAESFACDVVLPKGYRAIKVEVMSPESPEAVIVESVAEGNRLKFQMPAFLVYGVANIHLEPQP